ncbi:hypothetical protein GCM10027600_30660 [Nocardioides ginsengisegetis]
MGKKGIESHPIGHAPDVSFLAIPRLTGSHAGDLLSTMTRSVGLRPAAPWLPPGETLRARIFRHGLTPPVDVPWLDNGGVDDARVRLVSPLSLAGTSIAVTGLCLRVEQADGSVGDLVLRAPARPAWSPPSPRRVAREVVLVTESPYLSDAGPVSLRARQTGAESFELACRVGEGDWQVFADLRISSRPCVGEEFEPLPEVNTLPGLEPLRASPFAS